MSGKETPFQSVVQCIDMVSLSATNLPAAIKYSARLFSYGSPLRSFPFELSDRLAGVSPQAPLFVPRTLRV